MISFKAGVGAWPLRLAKRQRGGERYDAAMAPAFKLALLAGRVDEFKRPKRRSRPTKRWPCKSNSVCLGSSPRAPKRVSASFGLSAGVLAAGPVQPVYSSDPHEAGEAEPGCGGR